MASRCSLALAAVWAVGKHVIPQPAAPAAALDLLSLPDDGRGGPDELPPLGLGHLEPAEPAKASALGTAEGAVAEEVDPGEGGSALGCSLGMLVLMWLLRSGVGWAIQLLVKRVSHEVQRLMHVQKLSHELKELLLAHEQELTRMREDLRRMQGAALAATSFEDCLERLRSVHARDVAALQVEVRQLQQRMGRLDCGCRAAAAAAVPPLAAGEAAGSGEGGAPWLLPPACEDWSPRPRRGEVPGPRWVPPIQGFCSPREEELCDAAAASSMSSTRTSLSEVLTECSQRLMTSEAPDTPCTPCTVGPGLTLALQATSCGRATGKLVSRRIQAYEQPSFVSTPSPDPSSAHSVVKEAVAQARSCETPPRRRRRRCSSSPQGSPGGRHIEALERGLAHIIAENDALEEQMMRTGNRREDDDLQVVGDFGEGL